MESKNEQSILTTIMGLIIQHLGTYCSWFWFGEEEEGVKGGGEGGVLVILHAVVI